MTTIRDLYETHAGKVSDKWSSYFEAYEELLGPRRLEPLNLLEIGVQNGGSLEIWAKYFPNARHIVGCDINELCRQLSFADPRIKLFVGDANAVPTAMEIFRWCGQFDVVIDDGSHTSRDIVTAFLIYFQRLKPGGVYIAEDLHCSYWQSYGGGLSLPVSSLSLFKALTDIVNFEFWGIPEERRYVLEIFERHFGLNFGATPLADVRRVAFYNSLCAVHRRKDSPPGLGSRVLSGTEAQVVAFTPEIGNAPLSVPPQSANPFARRPAVTPRREEGSLQ